MRLFDSVRCSRLISVAALVLVCAPTATLSQGGGRPTLVKVDTVATSPLVQTVEVLGQLVSRRGGVVAAQVGGPVTQMHVDVGDNVSAGDVLAEVNIDALRARRELALSKLNQAKTTIDTRKAEIKQARMTRERLGKLTRNQTITRATFDDAVQAEAIAVSRLAEAEAGIVSAQADLKVAEVDLDRFKIKAPYSGIVVARSTEVGSYLRLGDAVVELIGDGNLEIEVDVPFDRLGGVTPDVQVKFRLDDGSEHSAVVRAVIPIEDSRSRTRAVRLTPDLDESRRFAVGQSATVLVPQGVPRDILAVHKDAIIRRGAKAMVYVVVGEEAAMKPVVLGDAIGSRFEVVSGLVDGDQVVVRGNERLRPGAKVTTGRPGGKPSARKGGETSGDGKPAAKPAGEGKPAAKSE